MFTFSFIHRYMVSLGGSPQRQERRQNLTPIKSLCYPAYRFILSMETKDNVQTHYLVHVVAYRRHPVNIGYFFLILFIYFWLCWVPASARGPPPPAAASGGHSSSRCAGPSLSRPLPLRSTGSRRAGGYYYRQGYMWHGFVTKSPFSSKSIFFLPSRPLSLISFSLFIRKCN